MLPRFSVTLVVLCVALASLLVWHRSESKDASAQGTSRPILILEFEAWIESPYKDMVEPHYSDLADGYLRVAFTDAEDPRRVLCPPITIPDNIEGWAYVSQPDENVVLPVAEARRLPETNGQSMVIYCELVIRYSR